ncbi:MAG: sialidase family protein [Isosphaeraceae bacterium]
MRREWRAVFLALGVILMAREGGWAAPPGPERIAIFPPEPKHNHASCVVETADGSLLAAWYSGTGERKADDVVIQGAWLRKGSKQWEPRFLMADTPGYPDCNPALFAGPDRSLWLFWPTILDHRWEGALLKFARCDNSSAQAGPPKWSSAGVLHVTPTDFAVEMQRAVESLSAEERSRHRSMLDEAQARSRDELYQRLGWMPRVHVIVLPNGRWILPLYSDTFSASIMAISDDKGASWKASRPLIGFGNIQPSLVRRNDGTLVAYMRDNGPHHRIRISKSSDDGMSWSPVADTDFPNPGAGIEAIRLASGRWAMVYNDLPRGRNSLAISVSDDEGTTWKWTRNLERCPPGQGQFHYPSMLQAADGSIHVTYTLSRAGQGSTIEHARLSEDWLLSNDAD